MNRKAIIIGATGLVGRQLVKQLRQMYDSLIIVARKPPKHLDSQMQFYQLGDFNNLKEVISSIDIDASTDAFTCLGTTKKQAGSEEAFKQVDYEYNFQFAKLCRDKGVERFYLLSALGADTNSRFFYNRVKAELEQAVTELGFSELIIFRPSLLLGKHKGRLLENSAQVAFKIVSPLVPKSLSSHPIEAHRVAAAMALSAQQVYDRHKYVDDFLENKARANKVTIIENKQMLAMTQLKS